MQAVGPPVCSAAVLCNGSHPTVPTMLLALLMYFAPLHPAIHHLLVECPVL